MDPFNMTMLKQTTDDINVISQFSDYYKDEKFSNDITSLINFDLDNINKEYWATLEWKKLSNIFNNLNHIDKDIYPEDCIQGSIGNCYLISAASKLAEYPNRLKKIFVNHSYNKAGIYAVELYIDSKIKKIIVDDYVPVLPNSNTLVFSKLPSSRNIWMIILEKAWAKHLGNYANTVSGHPDHVLHTLTGAPSDYILTTKYNNPSLICSLFKMLQEFSLSSYLICAASSNNNFGDNKNNTGINSRHAYSIIFVQEFEASGEKIRLIKLRNPWGKLATENFKGEIIKKNYIEYPEIKNNIGNQTKGSFILTLEEFIKYFDTIYLCKYLDNYYLSSEYLTLHDENKDEFFMSFVVDLRNAAYAKKSDSNIKNSKSNNKIFFSINKPTCFGFIKEDKKNLESVDDLYSNMFIAKRSIYDSNNFEYVGHVEGYKQQQTIELDYYENAEYILLIKMDKHKGKIIHSNFLGSVSVYSREEYVDIYETQKINITEVFNCLLYDYYNQFKSSFTSVKYLDKKEKISMTNFNFENSNYGVLVIENLNTKDACDINLDFQLNDIKENGGVIYCKASKEKYKGNMKLFLSYGDFIVLPRYKSGIVWKYSYKIIKNYNKSLNLGNKSTKPDKCINNNNEDKKIISPPLFKKQSSSALSKDIILKVKGKEMIINKIVNDNGVDLYFKNTLSDVFVKFIIKLPKLENLITNELDFNVNGTEIVLEPLGEKIIDFEIIDKSVFPIIEVQATAEEFIF